jgi:uncharacterized membrane protein
MGDRARLLLMPSRDFLVSLYLCRLPTSYHHRSHPTAPLHKIAMKEQLTAYWQNLRSSYWFIPGLMALGALLLAYLMPMLDEWQVEYEEERLYEIIRWTYTGGPDGARDVLSTIASSMINVAGVTFSITIVVLTLASQQFGPRLLKNFMRDTGTQFVLGTFVATFLYCLLILGRIRDQEDTQTVPTLSVTVAILLAILGLGVLIYFIHHIAESIRASNVISRASDQLLGAIDHLFPERIGDSAPMDHEHGERDVPPDFDDRATPVYARADGYVQSIKADGLMDLATEKELLIVLDHRPGDFVISDRPLARVWPLDRVDEEAAKQIRKSFIMGRERTTMQDAEFAVDELVEVAVRALSPSVNDPFTAMMCLDRLGAALCKLARRQIPSAYRYDENNRLRVVRAPVTFPQMVDAAFDLIRQHGQAQPEVMRHLLETIKAVAACAHTTGQRAALRDQAIMVRRGVQAEVSEAWDQRAIENEYQAVIEALEDR